jgi:predicted TIM-barrel fold metal-dependent hydrolase
MIIDMHMHLADSRVYPGYWLDGIKKNIAQSMKKEYGMNIREAFLNNIINNSLKDYDCSKIIAQMDEAGVDNAVILMVDLGFGRDDELLSIEEIYRIHYQALSRHPDRLRVFAGVDPRRGIEGVTLFEKGIKRYGFCGLKIYPPCGFEINDRRLYPLYEICDYYQLPVLAHVGPSLLSMKLNFNYPDSVLEVAKEFKNIPFILGHSALLYYEESHRLPLERDNIYLEVSGFQQIIDREEEIISNIGSLFKICPQNVLFGTDWPLFTSLTTWVNFFNNFAGITESQKELLFYKNGSNIFSMSRIERLKK